MPFAARRPANAPGSDRRLETADDTRAFGARLARILRAGDLVVLIGPLGAGKTALVQGIGTGLGVRGPVVSPTFVIARVHPPASGTLPLVHVDAYRLGSLAEVDDLDLDIDSAHAVTVVEWGAGLVEQLAESRLEVSISRADDSEVRTVRLEPVGGDWAARLAAFTE
ncbi:MAG: tRNA (adenosine(37)-N6)-threonylcarbamoyltransferase complex ATPase subunit type 1 TsaE [Actinomycetota bacterium]|nr:tRNA (adenosine(37)-N6)-threonylcarbamoyltransferase complex ATPase subunit type 1 TsaE [Actinomycetota bacterium]